MADDFPNLPDIMPDIAGPQVRPRRHGHAIKIVVLAGERVLRL